MFALQTRLEQWRREAPVPPYGPSLRRTDEVIAARVHLVRGLIADGWRPPDKVLIELHDDEMLLQEPWGLLETEMDGH